MKGIAVVKNWYNKCTQWLWWVCMHPRCKQTNIMTMLSADVRFLVKDVTDVPTVTVLVATVDPH